MIRNGNDLFLDLMDAVRNDDVNTINALCASNQNLVNHFEKDGYSPLVLAAECGRALAAKALIINGANVNFFSKTGICHTPLMAASIDNHSDVIKVLLESGADVNLTTIDGERPIILAGQNFQLESVRILIEHGANPNDVNVNDGQIGRSSLHYAAEKGNLETIIFLLKHGARINIQDNDGFTPLMIADCYNQEAAIELLVRNGANCDIRDNYGRSVIDYTIENENFCRAWLYLTADVNNEIYRSENNDINVQDRDGNTLLHLAADRDDGTAAMAILYLLFSPKDIKNKEITPEMFENTNKNMSDIVELRSLFKKNTLTLRSNIRKKNKKGDTPWDLAIKSAHLTYVELFLAVNATINRKAHKLAEEMGSYTSILLDLYHISDVNQGLELGKEAFALDFIDFLFHPDADFNDEENDSYVFVALSTEANIFTPEYIAEKIRALNNPELEEQLGQILDDSTESNEISDFLEQIYGALDELSTINVPQTRQDKEPGHKKVSTASAKPDVIAKMRESIIVNAKNKKEEKEKMQYILEELRTFFLKISPALTKPGLGGGSARSGTNVAYQYEDNDIQAILSVRLQQLQTENPQLFINRIETLAAVDNIVGVQLEDRLRQEASNHQGARILLIPCNLGNAHWVGMLVELRENGEVLRAEYIDSLSRDPIVPKTFQDQLQEVYPGANFQPRVLSQQSDYTSCGAYTIENLLTAALGIQSHEAAGTIRSLHLEALRQYNSNFYSAFNERQRNNRPTTATLHEQFLFIDRLKNIWFSKQELNRILEIKKCLSKLPEKTKTALLQAFEYKPADDAHAVHLDVIRTALAEALQLDSEALAELMQLLFENWTPEGSVTLDKMKFRISYNEILAVAQRELAPAQIIDLQQNLAEQIKRDEEFARKLQFELYSSCEKIRSSRNPQTQERSIQLEPSMSVIETVRQPVIIHTPRVAIPVFPLVPPTSAMQAARAVPLPRVLPRTDIPAILPALPHRILPGAAIPTPAITTRLLNIIIDKLNKNTSRYPYIEILKSIGDSCENAEAIANVVWRMIKKDKKIEQHESQNFDQGFRDLFRDIINGFRCSLRLTLNGMGNFADAIKRGDEIIISDINGGVTISYKNIINDEICSFNCSEDLKNILLCLPFDGNTLPKNENSTEIYKRVYEEVTSKGGNTFSIVGQDKRKVASALQQIWDVLVKDAIKHAKALLASLGPVQPIRPLRILPTPAMQAPRVAVPLPRVLPRDGIPAPAAQPILMPDPAIVVLLNVIIDKLNKNTSGYPYIEILQAIGDNCEDAESIANVVWRLIKKDKKIEQPESQNFDQGFRDMLRDVIEEMDIVGHEKGKVASILQEKWEGLVKSCIEYARLELFRVTTPVTLAEPVPLTPAFKALTQGRQGEQKDTTFDNTPEPGNVIPQQVPPILPAAPTFSTTR